MWGIRDMGLILGKLALASVLAGSGSHGESPGICAQIEPSLFAISDSGKVAVEGTLRRKAQYDYLIGDRKIEFSRRIKLNNYTESIDLDTDGKATLVRTREVSSPQISSEGPITLFRPVELHLDYHNGRCFVRKIVKDNKLYANSAMCRELRNQLAKAESCALQCGETSQAELIEIIKRHGGDTDGAARTNSVFGLRMPAASVQASLYLDRCASHPILSRSVNEVEIWREDPSAVGKRTPPSSEK